MEDYFEFAAVSLIVVFILSLLLQFMLRHSIKERGSRIKVVTSISFLVVLWVWLFPFVLSVYQGNTMLPSFAAWLYPVIILVSLIVGSRSVLNKVSFPVEDDLLSGEDVNNEMKAKPANLLADVSKSMDGKNTQQYYDKTNENTDPNKTIPELDIQTAYIEPAPAVGLDRNSLAIPVDENNTGLITVKTDADLVWEFEVEPESGTVLELEVEPEIEPEIEPEVEPEVQPEIEPEVEPEIEPAVEPLVEPVVEPEIGTELEPEMGTEQETGSGKEPESNDEMEIVSTIGSGKDLFYMPSEWKQVDGLTQLANAFDHREKNEYENAIRWYYAALQNDKLIVERNGILLDLCALLQEIGEYQNAYNLLESTSIQNMNEEWKNKIVQSLKRNEIKQFF